MKPHLLTATLACLVLMDTVQYAFGAAVMSVDLGSEWMKVRKKKKSITILFRCSVIKNVSLLLPKGWHSFTGSTNGYSIE